MSTARGPENTQTTSDDKASIRRRQRRLILPGILAIISMSGFLWVPSGMPKLSMAASVLGLLGSVLLVWWGMIRAFGSVSGAPRNDRIQFCVFATIAVLGAAGLTGALGMYMSFEHGLRHSRPVDTRPAERSASSRPRKAASLDRKWQTCGAAAMNPRSPGAILAPRARNATAES